MSPAVTRHYVNGIKLQVQVSTSFVGRIKDVYFTCSCYICFDNSCLNAKCGQVLHITGNIEFRGTHIVSEIK